MNGTEPIAAARWSGSCPRRSLIRAEAPWDSSFLAVERLFFEAQKWSDVWDGMNKGCGYGNGLGGVSV